MRILVTGATGFLGSRTIEKFAAYDSVEKIIAAGRTIRTVHEVKHPKIEYRLGDLTDKKYVESIVKGVDKVVNCAALSSPFGAYEIFKKANVDTQALLINACKKFNIQRYVYISTPGIYNAYYDRFDIKESDALPEKLINDYAVTKLAAEKLLDNSDLSHVIIRPRALIGKGDTVIMPRLIRALEAGRLRIIGDGNTTMDMTAVSNVADAIWLGLNTAEENCSEAYNITNGKPVKLWDEMRYVLDGLNLKFPQKKLSYGTAMRIASTMEFFAKFTKKEPTLMRYSVSTLANSLTLDISKAKAKLGYEPKMTTREAVDEFLRWYKK
ncbi:MAG: nucleoside-diphosphate-sugar epimerase [Saprospiraceae bacterium]|jgi:nucleoside-diphosphate-sugar epimerase